jgi:hypothetical protein
LKESTSFHLRINKPVSKFWDFLCESNKCQFIESYIFLHTRELQHHYFETKKSEFSIEIFFELELYKKCIFSGYNENKYHQNSNLNLKIRYNFFCAHSRICIKIFLMHIVVVKKNVGAITSFNFNVKKF